MVAAGLRNQEIARRLAVTEGTVKVHLHHIYAKLGIDGRLDLLRYAQERGLT
jgi:DNA-binding NarL/FixJ family response regulator